ncbi:MAG: diacylglycerol kinase [Bacteroidetes bacterium MedPE-SWsnd-G2]|nr:MAG: diacylglycerol kinase [Bacteroidetes bacterium MedPE-SWsnd-G2]
MKLLFVVNPISGGVNKEPFLKQAKKLCHNMGIDFSIFKTTGKNDVIELKAVLDQYQPDKVASVGGDGTTLFTSEVLLGSNYPMGIIPLGSANGMAAELYVNPVPLEALKELIMSEVVKGMDMLKVNDKHYTIHIGDVGLNANIVDDYDKDPNRGMATYAKYFTERLQVQKAFKGTIVANGETVEKEGVMFAICNSRKYGTGVPLNLNGNPMDGQFEIVVVEKIDALSLIKAGLSKLDDKFIDTENAMVITTNEAQITFEEPRLLQLDGEVIGMHKTVDVKLLKGAVNLITSYKNLNIKS